MFDTEQVVFKKSSSNSLIRHLFYDVPLRVKKCVTSWEEERNWRCQSSMHISGDLHTRNVL